MAAQPTPDLAAVLNTLSRYAQNSTVPPPQSRQQHQPEDPRLLRGTESPRPNSALSQRSATKASSADPSTITTWPAGLRYVHKVTATDEQIGAAVRRLIRSQHEHEQQWWNGRIALIQKQKDRVEGQRKLDDVLRAVGGRVNAGAVVTDDATELARYDKKVHAAMTDMTNSIAEELRALKIPFFCTAQAMVVDKAEAVTSSPTAAPGTAITRAQYIKLQRRMLEFLEDMFKED